MRTKTKNTEVTITSVRRYGLFNLKKNFFKKGRDNNDLNRKKMKKLIQHLFLLRVFIIRFHSKKETDAAQNAANRKYQHQRF